MNKKFYVLYYNINDSDYIRGIYNNLDKLQKDLYKNFKLEHLNMNIDINNYIFIEPNSLVDNTEYNIDGYFYIIEMKLNKFEYKKHIIYYFLNYKYKKLE